jgi:opacity protein-like surface antigen
MKTIKCVSYILLLTSFSATAADLLSISNSNSKNQFIVPKSAISFGVGGDLNYSVYGTQYIYAVGNGTYFDDKGKSLAIGYAQGSNKIGMSNQVRIAPSAQIKYFQYLDNSNLLFGANYSYSYLHSRSSTPNVTVPQWGSSLIGDGTKLDLTGHDGKRIGATGNALASSYQVSINHQMQFIPFVGYGFANGFFYIGGGPSLSQIQTNVINLIGFAQMRGQPTDQSGVAQDFSGNHWMFGGAASAGLTYFLTPNWYVDLNYTYSQPRTSTSNYWSTFYNPVSSRAFLLGTLTGNSYGSITSHSFTATMNYDFDLTKSTPVAAKF